MKLLYHTIEKYLYFSLIGQQDGFNNFFIPDCSVIQSPNVLRLPGRQSVFQSLKVFKRFDIFFRLELISYVTFKLLNEVA